MANVVSFPVVNVAVSQFSRGHGTSAGRPAIIGHRRPTAATCPGMVMMTLIKESITMRHINGVTVTQAAAIIGVSPAYVRRLVTEGRIPATKTPLRGYLLAPKDVQAFKANRDAWKARIREREARLRARRSQHT